MNFRETETENNCLNCKHFISYEEYYEDNLEPHDSGFCNLDNELFCNVDMICDSHDQRNNTKV